MASKRNPSALRSLLLFDAIGTGAPAAAVALLSLNPTMSTVISSFLGVSPSYVQYKFGSLGAYGAFLYYSVKNTAQQPDGKPQRWLTVGAALCNILFAAESAFALYDNKFPTVTIWGQQVLYSVAIGGFIFPILFAYSSSYQ